MKTIASTLEHRIALPDSGLAERFPALILLHGRGANEEDLLGLSSFLDDRLMLIAVRAPFPFEYGGYTWYDILSGVGEPDPVRFPESCSRLSTFVDDVLREYPIDPRRLFLLGFSMGAVMALAESLTRPALYRGVSVNSGYVPEHTALHLRWQGLQDTHYLVLHGSDDPVVPVALGRRSHALFTQSDAPFVYREYPMGHEISPESLDDIATWMDGLL